MEALTTNNTINAMIYREMKFKEKMGWDKIRGRCLRMNIDMAKDEDAKKKALDKFVSFLKEV